MTIAALILLAIVGCLFYGMHRHHGPRPARPVAPAPPEPALPVPAGETNPPGRDIGAVYKVANQIEDFFKKSAHPGDMLDNEGFQRGVDLLSAAHYTEEDLLSYFAGDNPPIGCMAMVALQRREVGQDTIDRIVFYMDSRGTWSLYFALATVARHARRPVIGAVLLQASAWWIKNRLLLTLLRDFVDRRIEQGEAPTFGDGLEAAEKDRLDTLETLVERLEKPSLQPLTQEIRHALKTKVDHSLLNSIGQFWKETGVEEGYHASAEVAACLDQAEQALTGEKARSVILVGEAGVGKSALVRALAERLRARELSLFEAGATELIAGQSYIGDLEERLRGLIKNLDRQRGVIWYVPNVHELRYAGRHRYSPVGILDMLMPYIESGAITLIGETRPAPFARLTRDTPRIKSVFDIVAVEPMDAAETLSVARRWASVRGGSGTAAPLVPEDVLEEALHLVQQFILDSATPGNLLDFLKLTHQRVFRGEAATRAVGVDDLYQTLSHVTGLPRSIMDERRGLDIEALRALFARRVMGQAEAVDCLVERIAMIKAGLTDPSRPLGVYLFAGPTGTGKTEIAKTLADFLFGSPERMIRLDMSEFKTAGAEGRILGDAEEERSAGALVNQIRRQPFSVVLLDEFEKAHSQIWDLFLQVFDEGRLTDRQGNTADFRHAIIILTSNLGAPVQPGTGIGFNSEASSFSPGLVQKAIEETFRPEFINRLDRVVVFRPLDREVMRAILHKELDDVLQRRGLRNRDWAIEWEASAIDFLLETGFTADLGARPLKRAIERHLLAPLAMAIVNHRHPKGGQALFVRAAGSRIEVAFGDPDAPPEQRSSRVLVPMPSATPAALGPHAPAAETPGRLAVVPRVGS